MFMLCIDICEAELQVLSISENSVGNSKKENSSDKCHDDCSCHNFRGLMNNLLLFVYNTIIHAFTLNLNSFFLILFVLIYI